MHLIISISAAQIIWAKEPCNARKLQMMKYPLDSLTCFFYKINMLVSTIDAEHMERP